MDPVLYTGIELNGVFRFFLFCFSFCVVFGGPGGGFGGPGGSFFSLSSSSGLPLLLLLLKQPSEPPKPPSDLVRA